MSVEQVSERPGTRLELPDRIRRELRKGESIFHSLNACHVSAKYPNGKWVGEVRRSENGRLVKYPRKAFATPQLALAYVKSVRPDERGHVHSAAQGEPTVADLYDYVSQNLWTNIGPKRQALKESRWRLHLEPYWGGWSISQVSKRAAQEWVTETQKTIAAGRAGKLGLPQFSQCRMDMHGLFEALDSFDERLGDKRNPFASLTFQSPEARARVSIESQHFPGVDYACRRLVEEGLITDWVAAQFLTSLFGGLRLGEVMALCVDQIDFEHGIIIVDRAMREQDQDILDPRKRDARGRMMPEGPVRRIAVNLPKGDKVRLVPMSDQLAAILRPWTKKPKIDGARWHFLFPSENGTMREQTRQTLAFATLCKRMGELASRESLTGRGWARNPLIQEFRSVALPEVWDVIVYRDTRNSFSSYAEEVGVPQATREAIMGHGAIGVTNRFYTDVTSKLLQDARQLLTQGWTRRS